MRGGTCKNGTEDAGLMPESPIVRGPLGALPFILLEQEEESSLVKLYLLARRFCLR